MVPMSHEYLVIDAFTAQPYSGNPAAVVFDADTLDDPTMQRIAAEFNLSETAFILTPTEPAVDVRFRWFTPACEVDLCGHATIAGVHAMIETGLYAQFKPQALACADAPRGLKSRGSDAIISIQTRSGILEAKPERITSGADAFVVWLELPRPTLTDFTLKPSIISEGLRVPHGGVVESLPAMLTRDRDVIVFAADLKTLNDLQPDFTRLARQSMPDRIRGFAVATTETLAESIRVQSRFFAPACGVNEDPVTGSAHGPLLAYLVLHGLVEPREGVAGADCVQSKPGDRSGLVRTLGRVEGRTLTEVQIGGRCVTTMRGTLVA